MPKSRWLGGRAEMSRPACSTRPLVWMSRPAIARRSVVLPHPEGPRKQTNSPSRISSEMSSSAVKLPNFLERFSILRYGVRPGVDPPPGSLIGGIRRGHGLPVHPPLSPPLHPQGEKGGGRERVDYFFGSDFAP